MSQTLQYSRWGSWELNGSILSLSRAKKNNNNNNKWGQVSRPLFDYIMPRGIMKVCLENQHNEKCLEGFQTKLLQKIKQLPVAIEPRDGQRLKNVTKLSSAFINEIPPQIPRVVRWRKIREWQIKNMKARRAKVEAIKSETQIQSASTSKNKATLRPVPHF